MYSDCHPPALLLHEYLCVDVRGAAPHLPDVDWSEEHQLWAHEVLLRRWLGHSCHYHRYPQPLQKALFAFSSISTGKWPHWRWVWMHSATTVTWVFSCTRRSRCIASSRSRWNLADLCPKCLLSQLKWFWGRYSNKNIVAPRWKQDSLTLLGYKHVFIWTTVFVVILNSPVLVVKSMSVSMLRYGHSLWGSGCSGFRSNAAHGALLSFPGCCHCSAFNQQ